MSARAGKAMSLAGVSGMDFGNKSNGEFQDLFKKHLNDGMHGLCFSAYEEGQKPGDALTEAHVITSYSIHYTKLYELDWFK